MINTLFWKSIVWIILGFIPVVMVYFFLTDNGDYMIIGFLGMFALLGLGAFVSSLPEFKRVNFCVKGDHDYVETDEKFNKKCAFLSVKIYTCENCGKTFEKEKIYYN